MSNTTNTIICPCCTAVLSLYSTCGTDMWSETKYHKPECDQYWKLSLIDMDHKDNPFVSSYGLSDNTQDFEELQIRIDAGYKQYVLSTF